MRSLRGVVIGLGLLALLHLPGCTRTLNGLSRGMQGGPIATLNRTTKNIVRDTNATLNSVGRGVHKVATLDFD